MQVENIFISDLKESPYQGRLLGEGKRITQNTQFRLKELAKSINTSGLLHPITVRKVDDKYEIIDGHRRVEAHKLLNIKTIESIIVDKSDKETQIMSVVANLQRTNLNNIEKAFAFKKILESSVFKSKKELSVAIGKDETYVGDVLNLLNLDNRILSDILKNQTTNDVRLLRLIRKVEAVDEKGKSNKQFSIYSKFIKDKLSRNKLENLIRQTVEGEANKYKVSGKYNRFSVTLNQKLNPEQHQAVIDFLEAQLAKNIDKLIKK